DRAVTGQRHAGGLGTGQQGVLHAAGGLGRVRLPLGAVLGRGVGQGFQVGSLGGQAAGEGFDVGGGQRGRRRGLAGLGQRRPGQRQRQQQGGRQGKRQQVSQAGHRLPPGGRGGQGPPCLPQAPLQVDAGVSAGPLSSTTLPSGSRRYSESPLPSAPNLRLAGSSAASPNRARWARMAASSKG